ncbi:aldo/keto reductase [Amycolatopsis sp. cmx-4-61]|uniref:aldo/keto reductase n=1 Tax=Amycolatopsis sp. cmx-4-61 TaxID=2790937 RepID=UPI00397B93BE
MQHTGEDTAQREFDRSLGRRGLDYLDLYLVHQPFGDHCSSWRAMQKLHTDGLVKAIGVSNFHPDRLVDLVIHNEVAPAVRQIETHPFRRREADQGSCARTVCSTRPGGHSRRARTACSPIPS